MKVLVFTSLYPNNIWPHHGVFVKERMTHVAKQAGYRVRVVAPVPYFPPLKINRRWLFSQVVAQENIEGVEVYHPRYFMTPKVGMLSYGMSMFLSALPHIKQLQRAFDFDIIDSHFVYPDGFAAILLGRLLKKPVVVSARGSDINLYRELPLIRRLLQYTLRQADKVIAVCQALKEAMIGLSIAPEKITVIPNGVDPHKFYPMQRGAARQQLNLPLDATLILSVGHLIPRKGFDLLITAFKMLVEEWPELKPFLVIIGEGESRQALERMIVSLGLDKQVRLAGVRAHHELYRWYSAADVFCLASSREGWPNVLLESLACGTPVVAVDSWGVPEIISSEKLGLLVGRDARKLADGVRRALKRPWSADELVQSARAQTWDRVAAMVCQAFESIPHPPTDLSYQ